MKVHEIITDRIIRLLESGTVPWRRPWIAGIPKNLVSGKRYRGINVLLLECAGYSSPYWLTYKQTIDKGGNVRKGEAGTPVVFWKQWEVKDTKDADGKAKRIPIMRYYRVFNSEQCENIAAPEAPQNHFNPIEECEKVVSDMATPPTIKHMGTKAYYSHTRDLIKIPRVELFSSPEDYYGVLFHELTHATGHSSRLDRKEVQGTTAYGTEDYSREELIAEMGAAFLCGHTRIINKTIDNNAIYIASWLKRLQNDKKLVITAASQAQKAADCILGDD